MSATTRVTYQVDASIISSPTLGFSSIDMLPANRVAFSEQLDVYLNPVGTSNQNLLALATDYTINSITKQITLIGTTASGLQNGDVIVIDRLTDRADRYTDFSGVGFLRADTVDFDSDNLLHISQEIWTRLDNTLQKNVTETAWNGQNISTINFTPGTSNSSLVTLGQVQAIIAGSEIAEYNAAYVQYANGNGSTTTFNLTNFPTSDVDPEHLVVTLDGVVQRPDSYTYTLPAGTTTPRVVFSVAPPVGAAIMFRAFDGLIQTVHAPNSINGNTIITGTLELPKLTVPSGAAKRLLTANADGFVSAVLADTTYITGFDTQVRLSRLDQMAAPTSNVSLNSNKITSLSTGTDAGDAVNKGQLDSAISGVVASAVAAAQAAVQITSQFQADSDHLINTWYQPQSQSPSYVYWRKNVTVNSLILQGQRPSDDAVFQLGISGANPAAQIGVGGIIPGGWRWRVRQTGSAVTGSNAVRITTIGAS